MRSVNASGPPPPALPPIPGFDIEGVIGRGGFGETLSARRARDGVAAAVKIAQGSTPRARDQLFREADAVRAVGPALAPALLGSGVLDDGRAWLALELLPGPSLGDRLDALRGPLPADELRRVALALAEALALLHGRGWRHLDLKPRHVFVRSGAARFVDFGLAEGPAAQAPADAPPGASAGTAAYMSPEQVRGDALDVRADVYAAGAILFELATGSPPFEGAPGELRQAHLAQRPPRPSERAAVPAGLEEVILRCLAKLPERRYADGAALRAALQAAFAITAEVRPPADAPQPTGVRRRNVGLLRVGFDSDVLRLQRVAQAAGGRLAQFDTRSAAVVFEPGARENAVRLALDGATALVRDAVATRAVVDLASVSLVDLATGPRYYLPPEPWPPLHGGAAEGAQIFLTARAAAAVPSARVAPRPDGLLRLLDDDDVDAPLPMLVGRAAVLERLVAAAAAALTGHAPGVVSVTGEAGMGKTALGAELAARLRALPGTPEVFEVRARDGMVGQDETLRALLAWALRLPPGAPPPADRGRAALANLLPDAGRESWAPVALALGWIDADEPVLRQWRAAPGALRTAAMRAAGEALRARARARPVCVLVDDAHFADAAALDALEFAALAEAEVPLFVCALARPALGIARPGLGERAAQQHRIVLGPLGPDESGELCRRLLLPAENVPARAVARLVERSRGIPVLLVELVRGLRAQGLVRQQGPQGNWYVATDELERVPDLPLVDWLARQEMALLPEALAAHARLVALLADEVSRSEVAGVVTELDRDGLGRSMSLDPEVATRRLLELRVLVERGDRVAFRHPLLRDAVAASASDDERRAVHRAAFRYYLLVTTMPDGERLPRLAVHAEACGLRPEAASLWLRIAEGLRGRHAYLEAETHYTRVLTQLTAEDDRGRFVALRGRGLVRYRLGRYRDAIVDLGAAAAVARTVGDPVGEVECLLDEATALDWMNDWAASAERLAQAERIAGQSPGPLVAVRLTLARGRALLRRARVREGAAAVEASATLAEPLGDEGYETLMVALVMGGAVLPSLGRTADAERTFGRALALASDRGDALHLASALNNRRNVWIARGDLERALEDEAAFLRIGRDLGMIGIEYVGQFNMGELLYQAGAPDRALPHVHRAVELERRHPEIAGKPLARLLMARLLAWGGDAEGARGWLAEVREVEARSSAGAVLAPSDEVLAAMVDLTARRAGAAEWDALSARSRGTSIDQEALEVLELRGLAALRDGRGAEALAVLEEALRLADGIPNVMRRRLEASLARARAPAAPPGDRPA
ncbi:serine/threonine-protein kinase PknK [Anaeromyxobacter sp. K]|uniref:serine/threonine-protein kinase n=1 Tax=Anaeromyxobacter sp. (strain K) TaxID=447217 RepID=UPI001E44868E|nr:protein kinase [Anaeromyxobacter sp. K]